MRKKTILIAVVSLSTLLIGFSYATFITSTGQYKASELLVSKLLYGITVTEDTTSTSTISSSSVTMPANTSAYFFIEVSSVNSIDSNFVLGYSRTNTNLTVEYTDASGWATSGFIKGYDSETYSKTIRVRISNTGTSSGTVSFAVFGGYTFNSIASVSLGDGYLTVSGPYNEVASLGGKKLTTIIEKQTNCTTSSSNNCYVGGETVNNYVSYSGSTWRIIGTFYENSKVVTKMIKADGVTYNSSTSISSSDTSSALTSYYGTLTEASKVVSGSLTLLSETEYNGVGGKDSFLTTSNTYFILNSKQVTSSGVTTAGSTALVRPVATINSGLYVRGTGTSADPYEFITEDVSIVGYTLNGSSTDLSYATLTGSGYEVNTITCDNGTVATWNNSSSSMTLSSVQSPDYCIIDFKVKTPTLYEKILADNLTIQTVTSDSMFSAVADTSQNGLWLENRSGKTEGGANVYFYRGAVTNNWVLFAGVYWRIIRTNEDGSVRLLYAGTTTDTTAGYINGTIYRFNSSYNNAKYAGYMYGTGGSQELDRTNQTNLSTAASTINTWYETNIVNQSLTNYINADAVYCVDRNAYDSSGNTYSGTWSSSTTYYFGAYDRIIRQKNPTYVCSNASDKFTSTTSTMGVKNLTYPVALMTADEASYAGGVGGTSYSSNYPWYYTNSAGGSITGSYDWWLLSPYCWFGSTSSARVFYVDGSAYPAALDNYYVNSGFGLRPTVSVKSCVTATGHGTPTDPYELSDSAC